MIWALIGALLIGISLGLLGSGGSILTVSVLVYLVGEPDKVAIAESLGIVGIISLIGAIPYAIRKEVDWRKVVFFGLPGMVGAYGGATLTQFIDGTTQLIIFGVVMLLSSVLMIRDNSGLGKKNEDDKSQSGVLLILQGLVIGLITGIVGVGGGFLIIPALVLLGGLSMRMAVGTSLLIITLNSILGFYKQLDVLHSNDLTINWNLILVFAAIGIAGSFAGSKLSRKVPQTLLKRGFGFFLVLMGAYILGTNVF